jgi:hypothetical protein
VTPVTGSAISGWQAFREVANDSGRVPRPESFVDGGYVVFSAPTRVPPILQAHGLPAQRPEDWPALSPAVSPDPSQTTPRTSGKADQ